MKNYILLSSLLLIAACGNDDGTLDGTADGGPNSSESAKAAMSSPVDAGPNIATAELPWGIPIMPDARYISGSTKFSKTSKKRGGEAIATIAFKGTVADIVNYYEKVLPELGFEITHKRIYDQSTARLHSENADGEQFRVSAARGGSKAREGESSAALLAIKSKLTE